MKRTLKIVFVLIVALLISSSVYAAPVAKGDATMKEVKNEICHIEFGKYGEFTKQKVAIDSNNKTIDISLTAKNNAEEAKAMAGEVILLIDSSNSMSTNPVILQTNPPTGLATTRKQLVLDAANILVDKLFAANPEIKIGVVEFATSTTPANEGTDEDAVIVTPTLLNDKDQVHTALDTVASDTMGPRTDIQVGLETAETLLSTDPSVSKHIVLLTDAIPNTARGIQMDPYTDASATPSKNTLVALNEKGINVISMLIDMSDDEINISTEDPKPTYRQMSQRIFGTSSDPTAGPVYYVTDEQIGATVADDIYADLMPDENYDLTDIVIKDYFPQNIIDNFDFAYLTKPDKGTVSATVDKSNNSITWTISELKPQETATFSYRLSLKDSFDSSIVGINLPTNKNVTLDYKENDVAGPQKQNDKCPVVILDVPAKKEIPQTGSNTWLIVGGLVTLAVVIAGISFKKYKKIFD